jgi:ABC-type transporter Mla maintaining outer membrane lipid asymmetry ATPase subunit MlaF
VAERGQAVLIAGKPMVDSNYKRDASDGPLVRIEGLDVSFGRQEVLRGIHLSIPRGQTLAVIGESGCGKTVLMKAIIGLVHPTVGNVLFDNRNLAKMNEKTCRPYGRDSGSCSRWRPCSTA